MHVRDDEIVSAVMKLGTSLLGLFSAIALLLAALGI